MCILAVIPHTAPLLSDKMLAKCWALNPDGAGFMHTDQDFPDRIKVHKGFMSLADLKKAWRAYKKLPRTIGFTVIHFRIGTSGGKTPAMTHPFTTREDEFGPLEALAHNGVFSAAVALPRPDASDTAVFAEQIKALDPAAGWSKSLPMQHFLSRHIGSYNKVAILSGSDVTIINPDSGDRDPRTGIWWSNAGWRSRDPNLCDPRAWKSDLYSDEDWNPYATQKRLPPPPARKEPAEIVGDLLPDEPVGATCPVSQAPKFAGVPPRAKSTDELWAWSIDWECWVCTRGDRKGAIAMPVTESFTR